MDAKIIGQLAFYENRWMDKAIAKISELYPDLAKVVTTFERWLSELTRLIYENNAFMAKPIGLTNKINFSELANYYMSLIDW